MRLDIKKLFETESGAAIYSEAKRAISDFSMDEMLSGGVLVGLSGGADSVMLLCLLVRLREEKRCGNILAVHVNHRIRGDEADRDEVFSRELCVDLGVEFSSAKRDVPAEAQKLSKGIEETARIVRYSVFNDILSERSDLLSIAVAHNATDNLETVIFNMMRGCGSRGASGISPVRDNVLRPLIYSPKENITEALTEAGIPYVTDSTNAQTDYKRNYIRHEILPKFKALTITPESQITRLCAHLRADNAYIEGDAENFLNKNSNGGKIKVEALSTLHKALLSRVVILMAQRGGSSGVEYTHVSKISELLPCGDFSVSLPGAVAFISKDGLAFVGELAEDYRPTYEVKLNIGVNFVEETGYGIFLSEVPFDKTFINVYKNAMYTAIDSDIIEGGLYVRERRSGDSYTYGGMTHKLKKIFCDKGIPKRERYLLPIICDNKGILWVPGFSQRGGGKKDAPKKLYVAVVPNIKFQERHC